MAYLQGIKLSQSFFKPQVAQTGPQITGFGEKQVTKLIGT